MREFDQVRAYCPPLNIVPGSTSTGSALSTIIGSAAVGTDYTIQKDGWFAVLTDPGKLSGDTVNDCLLYTSPSPRDRG